MSKKPKTPLQETIHWLNAQVMLVAKKLRKARRKDKTKKINKLEGQMNYLASKIILVSNQCHGLVPA